MADMQRIGDILTGRQETPEASNRREASKDRSNIVTPSEARARGIPWSKEPPPPGKCQFCGKELEPEGIIFGNSVFIWNPHLRRCDCEQAQAYWKEQDRLEAERKAAEEEAERQRKMRQRIARLLGQSGIKKRFRERTFPNFRCDTPGRKKSYDIAKE